MTDYFEIMYDDESDMGCSHCGGATDFVSCHACAGTGIDEDDEKCSECDGRGGHGICVVRCHQAKPKDYEVFNLVTVVEDE